MSRALAASGAGSAGHAPPAAYRRAGAALATEWIKLRSLRSMLLTPLLGAVASIGVADLAVHNNATGWPHLDAVQKARFDPLAINFNFVTLGILLFGVLGALVVTNEYGSGLIRTTLAATPQRGLVLAAKAVLAGLVSFALAVVITFTAFFTGQGILSGAHAPHVSLGDHDVLGHLLGTVYYMTAAGLIGLFTGVLVRSAAAAITSMFGLLLVLPVLADKITPDAVTRHTVPYLPANLGDEDVAPPHRASARAPRWPGSRHGSSSWLPPRHSRCAAATPDAPGLQSGHDGDCAGVETGPACRGRGRLRGRGARHRRRVLGQGRRMAAAQRHRAARRRAGTPPARPAAGADGGARRGDAAGRVHARRRLSGRRRDLRHGLRRLRPCRATGGAPEEPSSPGRCGARAPCWPPQSQWPWLPRLRARAASPEPGARSPSGRWSPRAGFWGMRSARGATTWRS